MARYSVVLDDYNVANIFVVDDRIMLVDLEKYHEAEPEKVARYSEWSVNAVLQRYASHLDYVGEYGEK